MSAEADYMPLAIEELVTGNMNPVDLYVKITEDKFVQVAKANTTLDIQQLKNYQTKSIEYLYIRKREYSKIARQNIMLAGMLIQREDVATEKKTAYLNQAMSATLKRLEYIGFDTETYSNARQVSEAVITMVDHQSKFHALLASLGKSSNHVLDHCVAVSFIATMIGHELGYEKKATLEKLALGGLLHDVGLKAVPPALLNKPLMEMTSEEIQIYETHSFKGAQLLTSIGIVPDDIVSIVYEHHENSLGQGYPQRIRDVKMHPLAKVIALANQFAELTIAGPNCAHPKSPREAIMYIEFTLSLPFNKEAFRALKRIVEREPQKKAS